MMKHILGYSVLLITAVTNLFLSFQGSRLICFSLAVFSPVTGLFIFVIANQCNYEHYTLIVVEGANSIHFCRLQCFAVFTGLLR